MAPLEREDDPRRRLLIAALGLGLSATAWPEKSLAQDLLGSRPATLPPGRSIYRLVGTVLINGQPATLQSQVRPGDTIETGPDGELIFVVGGHSTIVRARSRLTIQGESAGASGVVLTAMNLAAGKILSASRDSRTRITTPTAAIVIRGTGWYVESDPEETYFCTCYGVTDVAAVNDAQSRETIQSRHHDRPIYILGQAQAGRSIRDAPFLNHTDQELALIEALVGRLQPNIFPKDSYGGPRRGY